MDPAIQGWKKGWHRFGRVLLPLQNDFPEVIALMRYLVGMVSTNHSGARASVPRKSIQAKNRAKVSKKGNGTSVLLIPLFSDPYCLGSCLKIAKQLHKEQSEISILMIAPRGGVSNFPPYLEVIKNSDLRKKGLFQIPKAMWSGRALYAAAVKALEDDDLLSREMVRVYGNWKKQLLQWCFFYHYDERIGRKFLQEREVKSVVTINDVVKPAAPLITAGNQLGLNTVVLQHGTPGPQSAPFLAREAWVWGETSKKALEIFGADSSRLRVMGGLESEGVKLVRLPPEEGDRKEVKTLLFLGQWRATRGWGEPFFQEVFDLLGQALKAEVGCWKLCVRLHPTDPVEAGVDILARLKSYGVATLLEEKGVSMEEAIHTADALLSVNSSGLMNGISAGIPTAQILPKNIEQVVGPALLADGNLLRNGEDLRVWLKVVGDHEKAPRTSQEQVLANRGRVAHLMAALLGQHK